jgi:hypothetical protein
MADQQAAHEHVLTILLDAGDRNHQINVALRESNHSTARGFNRLIKSPDKISQLKWTDPSDNTQKDLSEDCQEELLSIYSFRNQMKNENGRQTDITQFGREDFLDFISTHDVQTPVEYDAQLAKSNEAATTTSPVSSQSTSPRKYSPVDQWNKGIKRDPSQFPTLNSDKEWDDFYRVFTAVASAQQVNHVLDPDYRPAAGTDEAARYELENTFMWSIVTTKFNTAKATELIRTCEDAQDAQKALELITKHYLSSAASSERAKEIWEDITGTIIPEEGRRKTLVDLITEFNTKVMQYNKLSSTGPMSSAERLKHLKHYLKNIKEMKSVSSQARTLELMMGSTISPDKHIQLFEIRATEIDADEKEAAFLAHKRMRRTLMSHEIMDDDESPDGIANWDYEAHLAAMPPQQAETLEANMARLSLDGATFYSMSKQDKEAWDNVSNRGKQSILRFAALNLSSKVASEETADADDKPSEQKGEQKQPSPKRSVNVATIPEEIKNTLKANKAETVWGANTTQLIDAVEKPLVTKEEAKDLSPIDIVRYTNQYNEFTADKKWRYAEYKKERKKDDDASTTPTTSSHDDSLATPPAKKSIVGKLRDRIGSSTKKKVGFSSPSPDV